MPRTKSTDLGEIPETWDVCAIGTFARTAQYGLSLRGETSGQYPILRMNCQVDGEVVLRDLQFVDLDRKTLDAFRLNRGDILFNRTNSYELVGRAALYDNDQPAVFASYLVRLSVDRSRVDPAYLNFLLNWDVAQSQLKKLASRGVSQANISAAKLKLFEVHLPPPSEQTRIADALALMRRVVSDEARLTEALAHLKRAVMRELFTQGLKGGVPQQTELGPIPQGWERVQVSSLGEIVTGTTPPTKDADSYSDGSIPFVAPGDIEHGSRIWTTAKKITEKGLALSRPLPAGAICFVCIGSTIGKVGISLESICTTNQQINSVIPSVEYDPGYVFHLLTHWSDHIRQQAAPSPVPILSKGVFEQLSVYASRDEIEQREIVAILDAIDRKIDLHKRKRAVLDELFKTLLQKLMTGEIRVADLDLSALGAAA